MPLLERLPFDIVRYTLTPMLYGEMWYDIHRELMYTVNEDFPVIHKYDLYHHLAKIQSAKSGGILLAEVRGRPIYEVSELFQYLVSELYLSEDEVYTFIIEDKIKKEVSVCSDNDCTNVVSKLDSINTWKAGYNYVYCTDCLESIVSYRREQFIQHLTNGYMKNMEPCNHCHRMCGYCKGRPLTDTFDGKPHEKPRKQRHSI